jgi:hypothetical protein
MSFHVVGFEKVSEILAILCRMPQIPVFGYAIGVSTNPQVNPPARIGLQFEPGGPLKEIPIANPSEFLALAAVIQAPGRLVFQTETSMLEKIQP